MKLSNLAAITLARYEEQSLKDQGKPHSEAVIACCDLFLNSFPVTERAAIEMSLSLSPEAK
jgi:hypothetical protein